MVANNNQRPMRVSALALPLLVALAIAAAWPTPALAASEASQPSKSSAVKPAPIEPVAPQVFKGDVRDLPKAERWKPGDPVREGPPLREGPSPRCGPAISVGSHMAPPCSGSSHSRRIAHPGSCGG